MDQKTLQVTNQSLLCKPMKKLTTLPKLKAKAQIVFNEFIRLRDSDKPCISCNQFKENKQAGHYYSVKGYDGIRFNPDNVHWECAGCNCFDESHLISYGENLLMRIGPERFTELKKAAKWYKMYGNKFTRSEIEDLIKMYTEKVKELKNY